MGQKKGCLTSDISIHTLPFSLATQTTAQVHIERKKQNPKKTTNKQPKKKPNFCLPYFSRQKVFPGLLQLRQQESAAGPRTA